ncbi:hypothetical protein B0H14DRAFT_2770609, partial [Mycena olivaceomarginata]
TLCHSSLPLPLSIVLCLYLFNCSINLTRRQTSIDFCHLGVAPGPCMLFISLYYCLSGPLPISSLPLFG